MLLHSLIVASLLGVSAAPLPSPTAVRSALARSAWLTPPGIRLWTSHGEVYRRGERVRVFFRAERDAFVTVFRVDTDGRVRVLFPREPWESNHVRGGATYDIENYGRHDAFVVDDDDGVGYIFAVASVEPFGYDPFVSADHWDLQLMSDSGRVHGDPYVTLEQLVQQIVPDGYADYDTHLLPYYVERRYDYPRFLCYDCHTWVPFGRWNPYGYSCPRFTLFIYNDPYYYYPSYWYPTRYYGGTRVVYGRPADRGERYAFKSRDDQSAPAIAYRDRRRDDPSDRRPADRGVRGADIGAAGTIPVPGGRRAVGGDASAPSGGRLTPETRIPLIGGDAQAPGRRKAAPAVTRGVDASPGAADAARRRAAAAPADAARQPTVESQGERPRGVYIDPSAGAKPQPRADNRDPRAAPDRSRVRRSEPVYLDRQPQQADPKAQPRPADSRSEARAAPPDERYVEPRPAAQPERRPESRAEPRPSSPPSRDEPRPSSSPSARPSSSPSSRPSSAPSSRPSSASPPRRRG